MTEHVDEGTAAAAAVGGNLCAGGRVSCPNLLLNW